MMAPECHEPSLSNQGWTTTAPTYGFNVARTSTLSAARLVTLANNLSPITNESRALDNGAGTGAVALTLAQDYPSTAILATDLSSGMLDNIKSAQLPTVTTKVLDARSVAKELPQDYFTHVFNTFMLQIIPTPLDAVRQMYEVLQPGGVIGIGLWARRNGPFDIWEEACQSIDPTYRNTQTPFDDPKAWRTCEELDAALKHAGFGDIHTEEVTMPFEFPTAEAFQDFWFGAKNPAAVKVMSNWNGSMVQAREAVGKAVKERYGNGKDIKTWAVLGVGRK